MIKKEIILENVRLGKFVHGGQCIAYVERPDAHGAPAKKALFVWGGLPNELVDVRITKKKSSHLEGIVTEVHEASSDRIDALEPLSYLSTSPWQIVSWSAENVAKQAILEESFQREGLEDIAFMPFVYAESEAAALQYRNKMEFGFWGDEGGLNLAHYVRGSHGKQVVSGSVLAKEEINQAAQALLVEIRKFVVWGGDLKTLLIRRSEDGSVVASLFVKKRDISFDDFQLPENVSGIVIYYSDPKSPASVPTKKVYSLGDIRLTDTLLGKNIMYDVLSFFQVNIAMFQQVLTLIEGEINRSRAEHDTISVVDMYSGVGTIGLTVGAGVLVESDASNVKMAKKNTDGRAVEVVHATSESALTYIDANQVLIVDPPRVGLHHTVIDRILEVLPVKVVYMSCNPSTQARDVSLLKEAYKVTFAQGYNFFPRTPHIESLLVLEKK